jgi:hypothetical protein
MMRCQYVGVYSEFPTTFVGSKDALQHIPGYQEAPIDRMKNVYDHIKRVLAHRRDDLENAPAPPHDVEDQKAKIDALNELLGEVDQYALSAALAYHQGKHRDDLKKAAEQLIQDTIDSSDK